MNEESGNFESGVSQAGPGRAAGSPGPYRSPFLRAARVVFWAALLVPALIVLMWLGRVIWSFAGDYAGARKLDEALETVRKAGIPVDTDDPFYADWAQGFWGVANATFHYEQAFAYVRMAYGDKRRDELPIVGRGTRPSTPADPLSEETVALMRAYLGENAEIFDLLHKGAQAGSGRYPIQWDGIATLLPHLTYSRSSARMLTVKMWLDAEEGRPAQAIQDAIDGLAIARPLMEEPILISRLVARAIHSTVVADGLQRVLARSRPTNEELADIEESLLQTAESLTASTALRGEVAMVNDMFKRFEISGHGIREQWNPTSASEESLADRQARRFSLWLSRGQRKGDRAKAMLLLMALAKRAENVGPEDLGGPAIDDMQAQLNAATRWIASPEGLGGPDCAALIRDTEKDRAMLRSAAACVAAMRWKNNTGRWPGTLEELVPGYLAKSPVDPFTGKLLQYKAVDNGVMVYSVGPNLVDDMGKPRLAARPEGISDEEWKVFDDAGFRIWQ